MKHDISKLFCHILFVSFALLVIGNTALEAKPPSDSDISVAMKADEYGNSLSIDRTTSEQKVNIDLQGANIKSAIRLVGEISGKNIVVGEDIKGNITIKLKNSSWRSALDAIAKMSGLIVSEDGNVISVLSLEQWKKTVTEKRTVDTEISAEKDRVRDNEIKELANQGKLRQISIEAKIVEATDEFIRSLGVKWGATVYGSSGGYPSAIAMGTSASTSRTMAPSYPSGAGFLDPSGKAQYMSPVNFPSSVASPAVGFVIGGSNAVLEAQLSALESNS
ncbi:MAG: secretin and TonB N-terminal domain-containing protein, partial [Deltaproteobacteria bacterium]